MVVGPSNAYWSTAKRMTNVSAMLPGGEGDGHRDARESRRQPVSMTVEQMFRMCNLLAVAVR